MHNNKYITAWTNHVKKKKQHQTQVQADNSKCLLHTTEHLAQQQKCKEPKKRKKGIAQCKMTRHAHNT